MAAAWLAAALGGVAWFAFPRDAAVRSHARWLRRATLAFALPALAGLLALGRLNALTVAPPEFAGITRLVPRLDAIALLPALGLGMALGTAVVLIRIGWLRRRRRPLPRHIVAPAPLAARSRAELLPATATALAAGVTEELAFRVAIPLATALLLGGWVWAPWVGFALATAAFVALHRYQRWWGRVGVALTAVALIVLWLSTGALWLAMLVHAAIDVMALAVRPWLAGFRR